MTSHEIFQHHVCFSLVTNTRVFEFVFVIDENDMLHVKKNN